MTPCSVKASRRGGSNRAEDRRGSPAPRRRSCWAGGWSPERPDSRCSIGSPHVEAWARRSSLVIGRAGRGERGDLAVPDVALVEGIEAVAGEPLERVREAGKRTCSPGRHGRPCGRNTASKPPSGPARRRAIGAIASTASMRSSDAGNPSRASSMAGARIASRDSVPWRACASPQERTAPGTVIASGPRNGTRSWPACAQAGRIDGPGRPPGRRSAQSAGRLAASQISQNASPPIPQLVRQRRRRAPRWSRSRRRPRSRPRAGSESRPSWRGGAARRPRRASRAPAGPAPMDARRSRRSTRPPRARRVERRACSVARSRDSGSSATASRIERSRRASRRCPRTSAAKPPIKRADDLADREEDRVQAHDRAAVRREPLGDVGEEAERGGRRAGEHEQPERGGERPPTAAATIEQRRRVVDDEAGRDQHARHRRMPYRMIVVRRMLLNRLPQ